MKKFIFLIIILSLFGCANPVLKETLADQQYHRSILFEVINNPENIKISKIGCIYEQVQKTLYGIPQDAPYSDLQEAWGTKTIEQLNLLHLLPSNATITELYRAVRIELQDANICNVRKI